MRAWRAPPGPTGPSWRSSPTRTTFVPAAWAAARSRRTSWSSVMPASSRIRTSRGPRARRWRSRRASSEATVRLSSAGVGAEGAGGLPRGRRAQHPEAGALVGVAEAVERGGLARSGDPEHEVESTAGAADPEDGVGLAAGQRPSERGWPSRRWRRSTVSTGTSTGTATDMPWAAKSAMACSTRGPRRSCTAGGGRPQPRPAARPRRGRRRGRPPVAARRGAGRAAAGPAATMDVVACEHLALGQAVTREQFLDEASRQRRPTRPVPRRTGPRDAAATDRTIPGSGTPLMSSSASQPGISSPTGVCRFTCRVGPRGDGPGPGTVVARVARRRRRSRRRAWRTRAIAMSGIPAIAHCPSRPDGPSSATMA